MKIEWNKKYTTIAAYALIVVFLSILFFQITSEVNLFKNRVDKSIKIFYPFIIGFVMSYLFNFILSFYEEKIFSGRGKTYSRKFKRIVAMVITYITVLMLLYVFSNFVFPQIISSLSGILNNVPEYVEDTSGLLIKINKKLSLNKEASQIVVQKWDELINQSIDYTASLIPKFANLIRGFVSSLWNVVIGVIVSIYLLMDKENFLALVKKLTYASFSLERADRLVEITNRANRIFSRFIGGKILDSFIVGIMTFIILSIFKIPFTILVSFIIGITNIIPFFGPFIGAVPSLVIIFFESPIKSLWFMFIIIVIQQIDGNIIGPKILGDSLGISAFWILFSLLITGKLFGFIGLVIGVPLFTLIYSLIKDHVDARLRKKNLPVETEEYMK